MTDTGEKGKSENEFVVKASRILLAKRWQVLRLITQVQDYSRYMPNVKECKVLSRNRNRVVTLWKVEMGRIPISWQEEDTLDFRDFQIHFKTIDGDLEKFEGYWKLQEHPSGGTEVFVEATIRLGIPIVENIVGGMVAERVKKNLEAILRAFEEALTARRYQKIRSRGSHDIKGFGVIGHPYNLKHLVQYLKSFNPAMRVPSPEFLSKVFELMPSYVTHEIKKFQAASGKNVHGSFIMCNIIPDMLDKDIEQVVRKVVESCKVAEKLGLGIVALGGFTSIAGEKYGDQFRQLINVPVTTGNTLTAAMAVEGVLKAARLRGLDLSQAKVTVIGGVGDIGSACARSFARKVKEITITSRSAEHLEKARFMLDGFPAKFSGSHDNNAAVRDADIVIAAASASQSIVEISSFKSGAIVCDIGYPKNIAYADTDREDILIFAGGICSLPQELNSGFDIGLPSSKVLYGCFSEAIVLSLEERYENYSWGKGNITEEKMAEILAMARRHGFELAPFFWGHRQLSDEEIQAIKVKS
ncbi:MAG TPA: SRPBCC family protein [Candidatus Omnitrophota bacterium]|nr:SRPBCC family protein [Candidatus Omnitrophota bacterium]